MIRLRDLLFEQPDKKDKKETDKKDQPNVLFIGDQQTASKFGYAYRVVKSKLVAGNIVGLQDITSTDLVKLMRRKIKDKYNVVVVQLSPDMVESLDMDSDIRNFNRCIEIASSYGAEIIVIVTPSTADDITNSDAVIMYEKIKSSVSANNLIGTTPYTKDVSKSRLINTNLQRDLRLGVISYINKFFDTKLDSAAAEQDADDSNADTGTIKDLGPAPANATAFINMWKDAAIDQMNKYGVPASITLAQGGLESGWGKSYLARAGNNYFGIKCHSSWNGEKIYASDDKPNECFRKYPDGAESFKDHSLFLKNNGRYSELFKLNKTDYEGWAKGLQSAGYATGASYASKLISIIKSYDLNKFDTGDNTPIGNDKSNAAAALPDIENSKLSFSSRAKKDYEAGIINPNLIKDIIQALEIAGVTARIGTAKTGHARNVKDSSKESRHMAGTGVDLDMFNGQGNSGGNGKNKGLGGSGGASFMANGDKVIAALNSLGYRYGEGGNAKGYIWRSDTGGNHWNHIHVSNTNK